MTATLIGAPVPPAQAHDAALYDLDGVIYLGPEVVAHAVESVLAATAAGARPLYVTNNSSREPETIAAQISGYGLACAASEVVTSAQAVALLLEEILEPGATVLPVGGDGLRTAVRARGFSLVESAADRPDAVVQGFAADLGWRDLAEAAYAIGAGARHVATNLDGSIPNEHGIAPGNGALVRAVVEATGVQPVASGKPQPEIFRQAAERVGARAPIAIGDRLDTDLEGARSAGMPGMLVLTGVTTARDTVLAVPAQRPSLLATDLRGLHEVHPEPRHADGWWHCGDAGARVRDGRLELIAGDDVRTLESGTAEISLDEWRALCVAAWAAADAAAGPEPRSVPALTVSGR